MLQILLIVLCCFSCLSYAQTSDSPQKIGNADLEYIFSKLPEYKQIDNELRVFETQLQNQLKVKGLELESKYKAYQTIPADAPDAIKKDKEAELAYLQDNLQKFQQDAQTSMQKKQSDLIRPVLEKVRKAVEEVALANGYTYIINPQMSGGEALLFTNERYNISDLVLKRLDIDVSSQKVER